MFQQEEYMYLTSRIYVSKYNTIHKITREIVNRAIETDSLIVLGKLKGLRNQEKKKEERRGRKFNRKLSGFPHFRFTEYLMYKAALSGIKVIKVFVHIV